MDSPRVPLVRRSLRDQVRDELTGRVMNGDLGPGDRIVESRVARELGVSQSTVREALRELEVARVVECSPNRGCRVRPMDEKDVAEVYPVRAALESLAAQLSAQRFAADPELREGLGRCIEDMDAAIRAGDARALASANSAFHRSIVMAANNAALLDAWETLRIELRTFATVTGSGLSTEWGSGSHRPISEALARGDVDEAAALLREHDASLGESERSVVGADSR